MSQKKVYGLSQRDHDRIQKALRFIERFIAKTRPQKRRGGAVGGSEEYWAYCKTSAGTGNTLVAYLNTDSTGPEITVNFTIRPTGDDLSDCGPKLTTGTPIRVAFESGSWRCTQIMIGGTVCSYE